MEVFVLTVGVLFGDGSIGAVVGGVFDTVDACNTAGKEYQVSLTSEEFGDKAGWACKSYPVWDSEVK